MILRHGKVWQALVRTVEEARVLRLSPSCVTVSCHSKILMLWLHGTSLLVGTGPQRSLWTERNSPQNLDGGRPRICSARKPRKQWGSSLTFQGRKDGVEELAPTRRRYSSPEEGEWPWNLGKDKEECTSEKSNGAFWANTHAERGFPHHWANWSQMTSLCDSHFRINNIKKRKVNSNEKNRKERLDVS